MTTPHQWITKFWKDKKNQRADGRSLYLYSITKNEYQELQNVLKNNTSNSHLYAACFVLYATECWRRNYNGSQWGWDLITDSIGITQVINPVQRGRIVEIGFQYWNRPIFKDRNGHRDYLGTVVIECGLPNYALSADHYLKTLIEKSFFEISQLSISEIEAIEIIERLANNITQYPITLRKDVFYQLINDIVIRLINLKREHQLGDKEKPVEYLDNHFTNWREDFPIQIDSDTGKTFLKSLLSNIAKIEEANDYKIKLIHRLIIRGSDYRIGSFIKIPNGFYSLKDLRMDESIFGKFSDKVHVYISASESERKQIGYIFKSRGKVGFQINAIEKVELEDNAFRKSWELILSDSINDESFSLELPNSDALDETLPWVFMKKNDKWTFKAQSSANLSAPIARIIFPKQYTVQCNAYESLPDLTDDQAIIEASETVKIVDEENSFRIRLAAERDDNFHFRLDHALGLPFYKRENKNIYIGMPKLVKIDSTKLTRYYTEGNVEVKLQHQADWKAPNSELCGPMKIRCLGNDNEVLFYSKIKVLPSEFQLKLSNNKEGVGEICMSATTDFDVAVKGSNMKGEINRNESGHTIKIDTKQVIAVESLIVSLQSNDFGDIDLKVPFPNDEIKFFDNKEDVIGNNSTFYLNSLHGIRVMLTNFEDKDITKIVRLELKTTHRDEPDDILISRPIRIKAQTTVFKPIIDYRTHFEHIISYSSRLDSEARIIIGDQMLNVKQYAYEADFDKEEFTIRFPDCEDQANVISISAIRMDKKFAKEELIECNYNSDKSRWKIPNEIINGGVWLFFPDSSSKVLFRPFAGVFSEQIEDEEPLSELYQAALYRYERTRIYLLEQFFDSIALQFDHPSWNELNELFACTSHLPLVTFNVWNALSYNQKALVTSFILLNSTIIEKLNNEFQINWNSIPLNRWIETFAAYREFLISKEYEEDIIQIILHSKLDAVANQLNLDFIAEHISNQIDGSEENVSTIPTPFLKAHLKELVNDLRTRHTGENDKWPDYLRAIITRAFNQLPDPLKSIIPPDLMGYTKPVVYLPIILAVESVHPGTSDLSELYRAGRFKINEIIEFDKEWFDTSFNIIQGYYFSLNQQ